MSPAARSAELANKIAQLRLRLQPIYPVNIADGGPHTSFPPTLLHFWLLTEDEIDSFASYYSQSTPCPYTYMYPATMGWDADFLARRPSPPSSPQRKFVLECIPPSQDQATEGRQLEEGEIDQLLQDGDKEADTEWKGLSKIERLAIKRRMVGKFIGLRGCDTPDWEIDLKFRWMNDMIKKDILAGDEQKRRGRFAPLREK